MIIWLSLTKQLFSDEKNEREEKTNDGNIDLMYCARMRIVEDIFVNWIERRTFQKKRRTWDNFILSAFSRIDRMWQLNEGRNEICLIGAIETFSNNLSKLSLLFKQHKGISPGEGIQDNFYNSSVGQSTEEELNSQTDCWLRNIVGRWIYKEITLLERRIISLNLFLWIVENDWKKNQLLNGQIYYNNNKILTFWQWNKNFCFSEIRQKK